MWVDDKRSWLGVVAFGGRVLPKIWGRVLATTGFAVLVTVAHLAHMKFQDSITLSMVPFTLVGLPLGIFLGFRNTASYDRFWEGRKLWGQLVNTSRSLTRQVLTLIVAPAESADDVTAQVRALHIAYVHTLIAYVNSLVKHLRGEPFGSPHAPAEAYADEPNVPYAMLQRMGTLGARARAAGWVDTMHLPLLEQSLVSLTDVQGACERIKSTPIPFSYTVLMHRIVLAYCGLLPLGIWETVHWATPVVVLGVSYALFGLDAVGEEIEQPFGRDTNDLPLSAIARTIEINLRARLGEPLPEALQPIDSILS